MCKLPQCECTDRQKGDDDTFTVLEETDDSRPLYSGKQLTRATEQCVTVKELLALQQHRDNKKRQLLVSADKAAEEAMLSLTHKQSAEQYHSLFQQLEQLRTCSSNESLAQQACATWGGSVVAQTLLQVERAVY